MRVVSVLEQLALQSVAHPDIGRTLNTQYSERNIYRPKQVPRGVLLARSTPGVPLVGCPWGTPSSEHPWCNPRGVSVEGTRGVLLAQRVVKKVVLVVQEKGPFGEWL